MNEKIDFEALASGAIWVILGIYAFLKLFGFVA